MTENQLQDLARRVLAAYQDKDIDFFFDAFADDVVLRDWNSEVAGKSAAVAEFSKNFTEASNLSIQIQKLLTSENSVAAQVEIVVDGTLLRVIDLITFTEDQKILSIVAYKGL